MMLEKYRMIKLVFELPFIAQENMGKLILWTSMNLKDISKTQNIGMITLEITKNAYQSMPSMSITTWII